MKNQVVIAVVSALVCAYAFAGPELYQTPGAFASATYAWEGLNPCANPVDGPGGSVRTYEDGSGAQSVIVYPATLDNRALCVPVERKTAFDVPKTDPHGCYLYTLCSFIMSKVWQRSGALLHVDPRALAAEIERAGGWKNGIPLAVIAQKLGIVSTHHVDLHMGNRETCVDLVKRLAHQQGFVMVNMVTTTAWETAPLQRGEQYIIQPSANDFVYPEGHVFIVCGWTRDGFIVCNTWGRKWGAKGFGVVPFDEFARRYIGTFSIAENEPGKHYEGTVQGWVNRYHSAERKAIFGGCDCNK